MANSLSNLNEALFSQLERLNNPDLSGDALETEIKRAHSVTSVSKEIVSNARTVLEAEKHRMEYGSLYALPKMLENKD